MVFDGLGHVEGEFRLVNECLVCEHLEIALSRLPADHMLGHVDADHFQSRVHPIVGIRCEKLVDGKSPTWFHRWPKRSKQPEK